MILRNNNNNNNNDNNSNGDANSVNGNDAVAGRANGKISNGDTNTGAQRGGGEYVLLRNDSVINGDNGACSSAIYEKNKKKPQNGIDSNELEYVVGCLQTHL